MRRGARLWIAIACATSAGAVHPAEDHSQHQAQPPATEASDPHAQHRQATQPAAQHDEHEQHRQPAAERPTESERAHVPPDPPQLVMGEMTNERMIELMQMEDDASIGMLLIDQVEWRDLDGEDAQGWEAHAWFGNDYDKLWFKTEGERIDNDAQGRAELLWDRIVSSWWSVQGGVRHDFAQGPSRTWGAIGVQGLAPYFFEMEATVYVGDEGRTAARLSGEYELLLTQRLVLQPQVELDLYGKDDAENGIGSGFSNVEIGLRLRYEIRREFAPYIGAQWERKLGATADLARAAGDEASDIMIVAGLRAWF